MTPLFTYIQNVLGRKLLQTEIYHNLRIQSLYYVDRICFFILLLRGTLTEVIDERYNPYIPYSFKLFIYIDWFKNNFNSLFGI
ncbi:hypothetical protein DFQ00_111170 [Paenibacillus barcinonensis]|uniref:Uncharacterized protein n=1 Tax=Paenibacillus barcinonensis TaxID=198119 RepID=A0A2V4V7R6_PAEBA|nr:hypothetical protein DFQ00_111170 [Paenibacillus barcinonensis]